MLSGAEHPERNRPGLVQRDRLVLLTLVMTGLRRSELIASGLVGRRARRATPVAARAPRQGRKAPTPAAPSAARRRARSAGGNPAARTVRSPCSAAWAARRLQPTILAGIIRRAPARAGI